MYSLKKIIGCALGTLMCASAPTVFSADIEVLPVESTAQLQTRGVGIQDFIIRMPTDQQLENCSFGSAYESNNPLDPKVGSIYIRMLWQHFEPEEGEYAWDKLDRVLECANEANKSVDLRLKLTYPGHKECSESELIDDPGCIAYDTLPAWLLEQVNTHTTDVFADAEYEMPDWNDSVFIEKHEALIKALGERYNGHPDLNSVDIGSVGAWGEWHIYGDSDLMPTIAQQKTVIDLYKSAFSDTPLVAPADSFYQEESGEFGETGAYLGESALSGWRGDSWGRSYFNDQRYQPINDLIPERWKTHPVLIETSDIISIWAGANIAPSEEIDSKDIQLAFEDALGWHVSQVNLKGDDIPEAFSEAFQEAAKKLGFRLVLSKATLPESAAINSTINLEMDWKNVGVAPPYRDFRIALRLINETGEVKAEKITEESVKGWLPEQSIVAKPSFDVPADLPAGNYALQVGLVFHNAAGRTLPIAVEGTTADNWFPLGSVEVTNTAPLAIDGSVTLRQDQQASVVVVASDTENQALIYRIEQAPEHGELTGDLPNVTYIANEEHPGTDSFSFIANDGQVDSNAAVVTLNVYPLITEGSADNELELGTITPDGDLSDWADVASFGLDGADLANLDAAANWQEAWMAHDDKRLYIAYQNNGPINVEAAWPWSIFLDTDSDTGTGYVTNSQVGADFLINGTSLFRYAGTGSNWAWEFVSANLSGVQGDTAEISILRSELNQPAEIRVLFRADNSSQLGFYLVDNYPNGSDGYFTYDLGELGESPFPAGEVSNDLASPLTLDGSVDDWSTSPSLGVDGNDITEVNSQADIIEAWMAHDADDLYIAYRNDGDINISTMWPWQVFIDTDSDVSSGLQVGNGIGAEFMIQGAGLYQYTGMGSDWSWQYLQETESAVDGDIAELKLPQSAIGSPDTLSFILLARNSPFTGNGGAAGIDRYPDESFGSILYRLSAPNTSLVIDGDLSDWANIPSLGEDGDDVDVVDAQADFLETWLTNDEDNLYLAYVNDGPINQSTLWPWQVFFDTDDASDTGYKIQGTLGAEFMFQGRALYKYTGTGSDWSWEYVSASESSIVGDSAEFKISRAALGNLPEMRVLFKASNWTFTDSFAAEGFDYFPDQREGEDGDYIVYNFN